jgi:hypothetical protein
MRDGDDTRLDNKKPRRVVVIAQGIAIVELHLLVQNSGQTVHHGKTVHVKSGPGIVTQHVDLILLEHFVTIYDATVVYLSSHIHIVREPGGHTSGGKSARHYPYIQEISRVDLGFRVARSRL